MEQRRGKLFGVWGEDQAVAFLHRQGFRVVERNFYTPVGEIDIVATKDGDYYFIEVKTRRAGEMAYDLAVTPVKRRKMNKTLRSYCYKRSIRDCGIVSASLMVVVNHLTAVVSFRLAVLY